MSLHDITDNIIELIRTFAAALGPAAMGSAVAQAWKPGLGWRQRLVQWLVGIIVSWFATRALQNWFSWDEFTLQAVSFMVGMMAYEVTPRLTKAAGDTAAQIPDMVRDFVGRLKGPAE